MRFSESFIVAVLANAAAAQYLNDFEKDSAYSTRDLDDGYDLDARDYNDGYDIESELAARDLDDEENKLSARDLYLLRAMPRRVAQNPFQLSPGPFQLAQNPFQPPPDPFQLAQDPMERLMSLMSRPRPRPTPRPSLMMEMMMNRFSNGMMSRPSFPLFPGQSMMIAPRPRPRPSGIGALLQAIMRSRAKSRYTSSTRSECGCSSTMVVEVDGTPQSEEPCTCGTEPPSRVFEARPPIPTMVRQVVLEADSPRPGQIPFGILHKGIKAGKIDPITKHDLSDDEHPSDDDDDNNKHDDGGEDKKDDPKKGDPKKDDPKDDHKHDHKDDHKDGEDKKEIRDIEGEYENMLRAREAELDGDFEDWLMRREADSDDFLELLLRK